MIEWELSFVLPNFRLAKAVECNGIALVPHNDERLKALMLANPTVSQFISGFTDQFKRLLKPNAILVHTRAPKSATTFEAIAGFRDLISLSATPYRRALKLPNDPSQVWWSDLFDFYPWRHHEKSNLLIGGNLSSWGIDSVEGFAGQASASVPAFNTTIGNNTDSLDEPLLDSLKAKWRSRYIGKCNSPDDIKLFRSLNMANQAGRLPAGSEATIYDVGRLIALWISAFEILAHPGESKAVKWQDVADLLDKNEWMNETLRKGKKKENNSETQSSMGRLYKQLYDARNDFLHGNDVNIDSLRVKESGYSMLDVVGPMYRMALSAFLDLKASDLCKEATYKQETKTRFYQGIFETGLLKALGQRTSSDC